jgi:septation ring formation regulator EzrA
LRKSSLKKIFEENEFDEALEVLLLNKALEQVIPEVLEKFGENAPIDILLGGPWKDFEDTEA